MVLKILRSKKITKRVLLVLLVLIIPAFVLWGVGSITRNPELIGEIDGRKIHADTFMESRQAINIQVLFAYYADLNTLNQVMRNRSMINFMAWERLILLSAARKDGIRVTNDNVLSFIAQHPVFQRNGAFDREIYNYLLKNKLGLGPRQFEELVRENLQVKVFRQGLLKDVDVSEEELLEYYKKTNDKASLSYVLIERDLFAGEVEVSGEEVEEVYETNKYMFLEPPKIDMEYVEFAFGSAVERNSVVRKIEVVYPTLKDYPTQFEKAAEDHQLRYGKTGPFSKEDVIPGVQFSKKLQDIAFALEEGEVSPPIMPPAGAEKGASYVLRKLKNIPPKRLEFEEVRERITKDIAGGKSILLAEEKANALHGKMNEGAMRLEEAAASLGLEVAVVETITVDDYIENVGRAGEIVTRAQETGKGKMLSPITVTKGVLLVRVDDILPADEAAFDGKKESLRNNILIRKQIGAIESWFRKNELKAQLKKPLEEF